MYAHVFHLISSTTKLNLSRCPPDPWFICGVRGCNRHPRISTKYYLQKGNACTSPPKPSLAFRPSVGPPLSLRATTVRQSDAGGSKQAD